MRSEILLLAAAGLATALPGAPEIPAGSSLNGPAWVTQMYGDSKGVGGSICGDVHDVGDNSGTDKAPLAPDCMAVLDEVNRNTHLLFYALGNLWNPDTQQIGFAPLITHGTCTFSIRPTKYQGGIYMYYVGYQDVADILHSSISHYQQQKGNEWRFGIQGLMPCTDRFKNQGDYELEFKIWNPQA